MPLAKFFRGSKRSNKENVPQPPPKNIVKLVEPPTNFYSGPSPYSVVTAPKTNKGPRSCPGAPMDDTRIRAREQPFSDRHSQLNSSTRYENLPRRRVDSFDGGQYRRTHTIQRPIHEERSYYEPRYQYDSYESDDDDCRGVIVDQLHAQIAEMRNEMKRMREKCREYKRRMEEAADETTYYRRNFEQINRSHEKLRKNLEIEKKNRSICEYKNVQMRNELNLANKRIMDLEEKLTFEEQALSRSIHENTTDGAGEALCDQADTCSREMVNSDTPSISMFIAASNVDQDKDEVRVFHLHDSDEEDNYEENDSPEIEVERSVRASPLEVQPSCSPPLYNSTPSKIGRSLSDTDLQSLASAVAEQHITAKTSTLDRTPMFKTFKLKENIRSESPVFSTSDDEDDEHRFLQQQYEKQLKRIGDAVKYKPPRKPIGEKYYRRFGKSERAAMEELKFLEDMSSDASGLLSSPDFVPTSRIFKQ